MLFRSNEELVLEKDIHNFFNLFEKADNKIKKKTLNFSKIKKTPHTLKYIEWRINWKVRKGIINPSTSLEI